MTQPIFLITGASCGIGAATSRLAAARGASTTVAAHQAGFADLAHMSRNFSATFGVVPSALQKMTMAFKREPL